MPGAASDSFPTLSVRCWASRYGSSCSSARASGSRWRQSSSRPSALGWGRYFAAASLDHALSLAEQTPLALFLWSAVYVILRDLFRTPASGAENVLGAICGYIIAGDAWGRINAIAYLLVPSAYSIDPEVAALLPDWHGRVALFTYYAFAQVLTIGYSDVTPVRAPATTLSLFAALFGVFYTAVVVSVFVGLAQSAKGGSGNE